MRTLVMLSSLLMLQVDPSVAQSGSPRLSFDSPGKGAAALIQSLKSDTTPAPELPGRRIAGPTPIIATVPGIAPQRLGVWIEFGHLQAIWRWLFPGQAVSSLLAQDLAALREGTRKADFAFMSPDDYLAEAARKAGERNELDFEVVNLGWSRDPSNTVAEIEGMKSQLRALSQSAGGRPLYIITHSWGSVLVREALERLAREGRPVAVRRFVCFGSPLAPNRLFLKLFMQYHQLTHGVSRTAAKPQGVETWINFWAGSDPYSGSIPRADANIQVDPEVPALIVELKRAAAAGAPWNTVEKDLRALTNTGRWHGSYFNGYKARLDALLRDIDWDIPQTVVGALAQ